MLIYPVEVFPADDAVLALDGTTDPPTGLPYLARGINANSTPAYEVQYNRRLHRQNRVLAAMRQGMVVATGPLLIGVYPVEYTLGGARKSFEGAMGIVVPDDATSVVYLDEANALQVQTEFPADLANHLPLATLASAGGAMTITDARGFTLFAV